MNPIHIIIIICTVINITGCIYQYFTCKRILRNKRIMENAAKDIFQMVVEIREETLNDLRELKPKAPYLPTDEEIDKALNDDDNDDDN